jgi:hypothetical protein
MAFSSLVSLAIVFATAATLHAHGITNKASAVASRPATGDAKAYTPIGQSSNGNHVARPLYYGMLMYKEATRGAILVPTRLTAPGLNMSVYATRTADGTIKLCLINKDLERAARVQIEVEDEFATTSILRLTAPSASAQTEITFGGAMSTSVADGRPNTMMFFPGDVTLFLRYRRQAQRLLSFPTKGGQSFR